MCRTPVCAAIINAVGGYNNDGTTTKGNCGYWGNTVILVTWDDWGGFYDDVLPWNCSSTGKCTGYPNSTESQYVYGFRVPLLVVSAWTPPGYVSGSPSHGGETRPYVHDFGSILNFTEWALGQNQQPLSWPNYQGLGISPLYAYADYLAPDARFSCVPSQCPQPWSLADFFTPFGTNAERDFVLIKGTNYPTSDFLDPSGTFTNYPMDPDNDVTDDD